MTFTPVESSVGGLLIGSTVIFHLLFNGRVSGISGNFGVAVKPFANAFNNWLRGFLYIAGLLAAGFLVYAVPALKTIAYGDPATDLPPTSPYPVWVYIIAGLCVGFGTSLGGGCTSGHMICGVARLSKRSIVATTVFCGVAFALVKTARTVDHIAPAKSALSSPFITYPDFGTGLALCGILAVVLAIYFVLWGLLSMKWVKTLSKDERSLLVAFLSLFNGFVFGIGLAFSGMTRAEKVLGFFDVFGPNFDPSLVCVAGGAIFTSLLAFQFYILRRSAPVVEKEFELSKATNITWELVVGAALFGVGWGLIGFCPGPLIVNLTRSFEAPNFIIFFACMVAGNYLEYARSKVAGYLRNSQRANINTVHYK